MKLLLKCDCAGKIERFLQRSWYGQRRKKLPPPVGSMIECDCKKFFELGIDGDWAEVEQCKWVALSSGSASFSQPPAPESLPI